MTASRAPRAEVDAARWMSQASLPELDMASVMISRERRIRRQEMANDGAVTRRPALQPATVAVSGISPLALLLLCVAGLLFFLTVLLVLTRGTGL